MLTNWETAFDMKTDFLDMKRRCWVWTKLHWLMPTMQRNENEVELIWSEST